MPDPRPRPRIRRRRIVERPRLELLLDRSRARIRSLVAGPGYGKTILLEQWASRDGRRIAWFRARTSATDVAVVARALQAASSSILPGAGRRMLERLSVTEDPEREAILLGEMLAEDLQAWPDDAWIVIDDYQHLATAEGPERFVEVLATRSPVQVLLASRDRPLWVDGKALLYGEVLEITQAMLAMTTEEAAEVLEGGLLDLSSGLLTLAEGWPAVIGLAGMAPDVTEVDADMPDTLYTFFADEVHRGLDPDLASALALLAALPAIDRELAAVVLGDERARRVCTDALTLGILDERDDQLELHPLAAAFHARNARLVGVPGIVEVLDRSLQHYRRRGDWSSAIALVATHGDPTLLPGLLDGALDELLQASRLASLEQCVDTVSSRIGDVPAVALARAHLALRHGLTQRAQALAESLQGESADRSLEYKAALLAGAAAHAGSREEVAISFYRRAIDRASSDAERREALWGEFMASTALELPSAPQMLESLLLARVGARPLDTVRQADKKLALGLRFGAISTLEESRGAAELLADVESPVVRASFLTTFSCALVLAADYGAGLESSDRLLSEAADLRIEFALPYASLMRASALAGLRRFEDAHSALDLALQDARRVHDLFAQQAVYASRVRVFLQERRTVEACAAEPPDLSIALPGMKGEVLASRALALACIGRLDEACAFSTEAATSTRGIEASVLARCVDAVVAVRRRDDDLLTRLRQMVDVAYGAGAVDMVITTYRASPDVLGLLLKRPETAETTGYIVARAGDADLAAEVGVGISDALDPVKRLSKRERDVYELVCEGLGTARIAKMLFISEATVKLHLQRVFDKIGVRSRAALIHFEANRRSGQATSSAGATSKDSSGADDAGPSTDDG